MLRHPGEERLLRRRGRRRSRDGVVALRVAARADEDQHDHDECGRHDGAREQEQSIPAHAGQSARSGMEIGRPGTVGLCACALIVLLCAPSSCAAAPGRDRADARGPRHRSPRASRSAHPRAAARRSAHGDASLRPQRRVRALEMIARMAPSASAAHGHLPRLDRTGRSGDHPCPRHDPSRCHASRHLRAPPERSVGSGRGAAGEPRRADGRLRAPAASGWSSSSRSCASARRRSPPAAASARSSGTARAASCSRASASTGSSIRARRSSS